MGTADRLLTDAEIEAGTEAKGEMMAEAPTVRGEWEQFLDPLGGGTAVNPGATYRIEGRKRGFLRRAKTTLAGPWLLQAQALSAVHVEVYAVSWWPPGELAGAKKWVEGQVELIDRKEHSDA